MTVHAVNTTEQTTANELATHTQTDIVGDFAINATKLNEQELASAELCRQCCILNLLSLD